MSDRRDARSLDCYLGGRDRTAADVSPLLATNEIDPLRDEAEACGARLREAGVAMEAIRLGGMIHGCLQRGARLDAGDALITLVAERLRRVATGF